MYASHGFLRSDIGDVDVVYHDGEYHLFHLVLPNHDFIAHAVSRDGMTWRRVQNALFVDDPGAWDDDMLWTMHVTADPDAPGRWRMFYTGLSRHEYDLVRTLPDASHCFLIRHGKESVVARLDLTGESELLTILSGREATVRLFDEIADTHGTDPADWMQPLLDRAA